MLAAAPKTDCSTVPDDLEHAHRLSAMGELAAGLAHEIQQRLTVIANYANGCVHRLENDRITTDELISLMRQIAETAMQANDITRRARNFSKKQAPEFEILDLHEMLTMGVDFVRNQAEDEGVEISLQLQAASPMVVADRTLISQVIMNLLLNAIESMAGHRGERKLCVETATNGDEFLHVTITDTGVGIPAEIQLLVFEPFYTTKSNGMGIGLGLCRSIIEQHFGNMTLESEKGAGAKIGFSLPRGIQT
ncbi:Sensor protein FixL [Symmachiella dynata]|uniref:histidine kinase n=1 Tax=Symmachiella dynata TaxID=2527995 RepID=A0A517ZPN2_9PLAN|nr:ATP-binding protein [Symmachiella dynata]QDU44439.1 Sensor protein FixL [Symmachiella dynata]